MVDEGIVLVGESGSKVLGYTCKDIPVFLCYHDTFERPDYSEMAHWHDDLEFAVVLEGELNFCVDGELITVRKNQGIFINAKRIHYLYSGENRCEAIRFAVNAERIYPQSAFYTKSLQPLLSALPPYGLLNMDGEGADILITIKHLYENLQSEAFSVLALSAVMNILHCLYGFYAKRTKSERKDRSFNTVRQMLDFIRENYAEPITLADIASAGNVCKSSCSAAFNAVLHQSPVDFLIEYRLAKAKELLETTEKSVSEIAMLVGFSSMSYFTERFKRTYGMPPRDFRKRL